MEEAPPPAWIHWPVRVLAVLFVLPFRLAWELLRATGRFLARYVGRPLAWLGHHLIVIPAAFLWRYLVAVPATFLWHYLVAVPGRWLWHHLVAVPGEWLWRWLVVVPARWLWLRRRFLLRPLELAVRYLIVIPVGWIVAVITPAFVVIGNGIAALARGLLRWVLLPGWHGAGWVLRQIYRWLLRPVGVAVAWGWRHTVVPAYRVVAAGGRWVRESLLRPSASMARAVLISVGLRR